MRVKTVEKLTSVAGRFLMFHSSDSIACSILDIEEGGKLLILANVLSITAQSLITNNNGSIPDIVWQKNKSVTVFKFQNVKGNVCLDVSKNPHGRVSVFYERLQDGASFSTLPANAPNVTIQQSV